jgi:protein ImuB
MFCCLVSSHPDAALDIARAFSPRVARIGEVVVFDAGGCSRAIGPPAIIASEIQLMFNRLNTASGMPAAPAHVAIAPTVTAAWLLAHACEGPTVVPAQPAARSALAAIPVGWLSTLTLQNSDPRTSDPALGARSSSRLTVRRSELQELLSIFERWGLRTLGDVATLPRADVHARLGPIGVRLHEAACGEDAVPFVPSEEAPRFIDRMVLEWPVEGLEPLAFVLARQCDRLSAALERADRGAAAIRTRLRLVTRDTHERVLQLPSPMRDARILRTLILLDLESHPPAAAIDVVEIELDAIPGRIVQGALFAPTLPKPEDLATLMARLTALAGESRVGSPVLPDSFDARAVGMAKFRLPGPGATPAQVPRCAPVLRRFRLPMAVRVLVERGAPVRVIPGRGCAGGRVLTRAGPWRTSGGWWTLGRAAWDRDEWDLELTDGGLYRLARDRSTGQWVIEGVLD